MNTTVGMSDVDYILTTLNTNELGIARTQCDENWAPPTPFSDPFGRIYWVIDGEAWVEHHEQRYDLHPGMLTVIPSNTLCRYVCPERMLLDWMHFSAQVLHSIDLFALLRMPYQIKVKDPSLLSRQWEEAVNWTRAQTAGAGLAVDGFLRYLLAQFLDNLDPNDQNPGLEGVVQFRAVLAYIEQHISEPVTLRDLAAVVDWHPTYFSNRFAQIMGKTPISYLNRRRIEMAKHLLWDKTLPIRTVATAVGFCDEYYFSRVFRRVTNVTPGQFRRAQYQIHP